MSEVSHWMHVDVFTVEQAAALWCGTDPAKLSPVNSFNRSEILAVKQMLYAAILTKEISADTFTNGLAIIGDHSKSLVARCELSEGCPFGADLGDWSYHTSVFQDRSE